MSHHRMGERRFEPIPPGWFDCPPIGAVSKEHHLIPMKVGDASNINFAVAAQHAQTCLGSKQQIKVTCITA